MTAHSANLSHRGFISITGDDALTYLQSIITNDVFQVASGKTVYACFLTPQGKYLADFYLYPVEGGVLLDVDQSLLPDLFKRLTMYRLRSKVVLADVSNDYSVTAVWNTDVPPENGFTDPRGDAFGYRILNSNLQGYDDYTLWQYKNGLPDVNDFERERTTMAEANLDFLNAVSWTKGCYMGQEITARMHYRGLVKKRFLPFELSLDKEIPADTPITRDGKTIGYIRGVYKNRALGVIMLESLEQGHQCEIDGIAATIEIPDWFIQQ